MHRRLSLARGLRLFFVALLLVAGMATSGDGVLARGRVGDTTAVIRVAQLPPEARATLELIRQGGPFPYRQDGGRFGNREGLLPPRERGYYTEYTVRTPGARDRGARRIVAGGAPRFPSEFWYTNDHYRSFSRIVD